MKLISSWQPDVLHSMCTCVCPCVCSCFCTSVVNISGDLDVTLLRVDRQFIEVFIFFQREFSSQRHRIPILIHRVDHQGVKVVELYGTVEDDGIIGYLVTNYRGHV